MLTGAVVRITIIGTGYVGTVTATCFAWLGHDVRGLDVDSARVARLEQGEAPFHEPGLATLLADTMAGGRLSFTSQPEPTLCEADVVFLCVGTPPGLGGLPDLSQLESAAQALAPYLRDGVVVVNKSTVPVGSGNWVRTILEEALPRNGAPTFSVVSNPEFLREGAAIDDFLYPDRIVLGGEDSAPHQVAALYDRVLRQDFPGGRPEVLPELILTDLPSAELIKYSANAFLATKISFANEVASLCELVGADARQVLPAIGADRRIGSQFLSPGIGWGGSCFGKDIAALVATGLEYGHNSSLLRATIEVNEAQRAGVLRRLQQVLKVVKGRRIAILGLAFKPGTDDLRDAPALDIARRLLAIGAVVSAYDPIVKALPDDLAGVRLADNAYAAADRADAVILATEWDEFAGLDLVKLAEVMVGRVLLDGRNAVVCKAAEAAGLRVVGVGW